MRGTLGCGGCGEGRSGLIPTYAGNTVCECSAYGCAGAHPHVCGEHYTLPAGKLVDQGSSPRMRGTRHNHLVGVWVRGLIPTYAGNTGWLLLKRGRLRAHPHVCGEHFEVLNGPLRSTGSSPRMRGTLTLAQAEALLEGLIPTYAGNTRQQWRYRRAPRAHPHVCGEHRGIANLRWYPLGSSPRMRGTPRPGVCAGSSAGLIPTYAGNTVTSGGLRPDSRAHPHVCGEHGIIPATFPRREGSSPRMRGTLGDVVMAAEQKGLIPTYAGNTFCAFTSCSLRWAHPHVCGEHRSSAFAGPISPGSSPRMRGTRQPHIHAGLRLRLIPTYAGNTPE